MSHFTVLVTKTNGKDVESQLERFYEQGEEGDYFMEKDIEVKAEDMEKRAREILEDEYVKKNAELTAKYTKYIEEGNFTQLCQDFNGGELDEEGNLYYLSNPEAKWDWWLIGGRWTGYFRKKAGAEGEVGTPGVMTDPATDPDVADVIKVKDIDWDAMDEAEKKRRGEFFDKYDAEKNSPFVWSKSEVQALTTLSREEYINRPVSHSTHAVLHDDEWYERGEMGWWGIVVDEKNPDEWDSEWRKLVESLDPETEVTIVDCHI